MALIQRGSFEDFSVIAVEPTEDFLKRGFRRGETSVSSESDTIQEVRSALNRFRAVREVREAARAYQPVSFKYPVSAEPRGLALKSLTINKGFEGFLQNVFNPINEVYLIAWCWDLSGGPVYLYPQPGDNPSKYIIPMKAGEKREFIGEGALLFPARTITSGLAVRIMLYESDSDVRKFGETLSKVANAISASQLSKLLFKLGTSTATPQLQMLGATIEASAQLAGIIGKILEKNDDDYVDFFEGYYSVSESWTSGEETYRGIASEITLTRLI